MSALRLELGSELTSEPCGHCPDGVILLGQGFLHEGADATAMYWVGVHRAQTTMRERLLLVLDSGLDQENFDPGISVVVDVRGDGNGEAICALIEPSDSPVVLDADTGATLTREQALAHEQLASIWKLIDFVVQNDPTVVQTISASQTG